MVSAVGHETDFSLSDFAADLRAPAPRWRPELLVPDQRELALRLHAACRMVQLQRHAMQQAMQRRPRLTPRPERPSLGVDLLRRRQLDLGRRLHTAFNQQQERRAPSPCSGGPARVPPTAPARAMQRHLAACADDRRQRCSASAGRDAPRLRGLARSLEAVSPLATVARGYSILTRSDVNPGAEG
ncbi:exodeoxyribonuclease VII large subunit [Azotobacter sp. CWF10]